MKQTCRDSDGLVRQPWSAGEHITSGCGEFRMQAARRNIGSTGSLQEAAVVCVGKPMPEADGTAGKAQAGREGRGQSCRVPLFALPATPPGEGRRRWWAAGLECWGSFVPNEPVTPETAETPLGGMGTRRGGCCSPAAPRGARTPQMVLAASPSAPGARARRPGAGSGPSPGNFVWMLRPGGLLGAAILLFILLLLPGFGPRGAAGARARCGLWEKAAEVTGAELRTAKAPGRAGRRWPAARVLPGKRGTKLS